MTLDVSIEATKVRRRVGSPDVTELPEDDLQAFFTDEALDWYNRRRPGSALSYFETVAGQQDYTVVQGGMTKLARVWWQASGLVDFSPLIRFYPGDVATDTRLSGFVVMDNPAIYTAVYKFFEQYRRSFKGKAKILNHNQVRLSPYPGTTGAKVYFEYLYKRHVAVTSAEDTDVEGIRDYVGHLAAGVLSLKRGRTRSGRNYRSGGGEREAELAGDLLADAEVKIPIYRAPFYRG